VNGLQEMVGSDENRVREALNKPSSVLMINLELVEAEKIEIRLPTLSSDRYEITVFITQDKHTQSISAGENQGRTVTYTHSVKAMREGGAWNGRAMIKSLYVGDLLLTGDRLVALVQNSRTGAIVIAGQISL
jgi:hypothetical protein